MTVTKRILNPERLRQVPENFRWIDHRLVRDHTIEKADAVAWALYLFLVAVADARGLSYYAEATLSRRLGLDPRRLTQARTDLIGLDLIAYAPPCTKCSACPMRRRWPPSLSPTADRAGNSPRSHAARQSPRL